MIEEAAWADPPTDLGGKTVVLRRGQLSHSIRFLAGAWKWHRSAVQRLLRRMSEVSMICADRERVTSRIGAIVAILNYKEYQGLIGDEDGGLSQSRASSEPNLSPTGAKNKEGNTGKKEDYGLYESGVGRADCAR